MVIGVKYVLGRRSALWRVLLPAVSETIILVAERLLSAALVRRCYPVEIVVGIGPGSVQEVITCQNITIRRVSEGEAINRTVGERGHPPTIVILEIAHDTIPEGGLLHLTESVVCVHRQQRAGVICVNIRALHLRQARCCVVGVGVCLSLGSVI